MSKNIFNVLARHDDSDDEGHGKTNSRLNPGNKQANANAQPQKETKKEARAKDSHLREKYGDVVDKDSRPQKYNNQRPRDDYGPNEKRPYERHSGTGRPAFKKDDYKKGGHGKGNVGNKPANPEDAEAETQNAVAGEETTEGTVNIVKLPEEEIVTLDDYVSNTGARFGIKGESAQVKNKDPKAFEDANTKAIVSKRTQNADDQKKTTKQTGEKKQANKNVIEVQVGDDNQRRRDNRQGNNKQGYVKYDKNEFPSLD